MTPPEPVQGSERQWTLTGQAAGFQGATLVGATGPSLKLGEQVSVLEAQPALARIAELEESLLTVAENGARESDALEQAESKVAELEERLAEVTDSLKRSNDRATATLPDPIEAAKSIPPPSSDSP